MVRALAGRAVLGRRYLVTGGELENKMALPL